jgi:hypothetical protein
MAFENNRNYKKKLINLEESTSLLTSVNSLNTTYSHSLHTSQFTLQSFPQSFRSMSLIYLLNNSYESKQ